MAHSLYMRIYRYAEQQRHRPMWKRRLHALNYSASIPTLARIK